MSEEKKIDYHIKIACFKTKNWIGNGQLIPAGPLREKITSLRKFDAVFLNGNSDNLEEIKNQIHNINPKIEIFKTFYEITNIQQFNLNFKYLIYSGIGNPSDFKNILLKNEFEISKEIIFSDHYEYQLNDFKKIQNIAKSENLKIITTEKDYMKVPDQFKKEIDYLTIDLVIENENKLIDLLNN